MRGKNTSIKHKWRYKLVFTAVFLLCLGMNLYARQQTREDVWSWLLSRGKISLQKNQDGAFLSVQESVDPEGEEVLPEDWAGLRLDSITDISFYEVDFKPADFSLLSKFSKLRSLRISHCNFARRHFETIDPLDSVQELGLIKTEIDDEALELSDENTNNCLESLFFLQNLKELKINNHIKANDLGPLRRKIPALEFSRSFNLD